MGRTKDDFMNVRIRAEMDEHIYSQIPEILKDEMKIKSIEAANFKEVYRKDEQWRKFNTLVGDAMEARSEWEAKIRIENR
tara:strand:+ start:436 stop:675 length:240 start_codon:yes stop_codon:yes gene_type:complete